MATNNSTRLGVDDEDAIRRFWTASTLKGVSESAIGKAIAARENPENGLATKGKA